jgi:RNA polymerase sigma factor (sigma-70 family)
MGNNILQWDSVIAGVLNLYARKLSKDKKDDLRQEIYLALLESEPPVTSVEQANRLANRVIDRSRKAHKREKQRTTSSGLLEDNLGVLEPEGPIEVAGKNKSTITLLEEKAGALFRCDSSEQKAPLAEAVDQLPAILQEILNETFYEGLTQEEIAVKHQKSERWVRYKKDQALTFLRNYLNSRRTTCQ